jgi:type III secretory pathway component EscV
MFGPLNGVRTALVIAAALAAIVCLIVGYPGAALVLVVGIVIHGLGWLYLYANSERTEHDH